ncbi:hypothetical protein HAX54_018551, partial [Datura stramonium]|nr:hypothetical protein [Datura stramonium]
MEYIYSVEQALPVSCQKFLKNRPSTRYRKPGQNRDLPCGSQPAKIYIYAPVPLTEPDQTESDPISLRALVAAQ